MWPLFRWIKACSKNQRNRSTKEEPNAAEVDGVESDVTTNNDGSCETAVEFIPLSELLGCGDVPLSRIRCSASLKRFNGNESGALCEFYDLNGTNVAFLEFSLVRTDASFSLEFEAKIFLPTKNTTKERRAFHKIICDFFVAQGASQPYNASTNGSVSVSSETRSARLILRFLKQFNADSISIFLASENHIAQPPSMYLALASEIKNSEMIIERVLLCQKYVDEFLPLINIAYEHGCKRFVIQMSEEDAEAEEKFPIAWILTTPLFNDIFGYGKEAFDRYVTAIEGFTNFAYNEMIESIENFCTKTGPFPFVVIVQRADPPRRPARKWLLVPYLK